MPVIGLFQKIGLYIWVLLSIMCYLISRKQYAMLIPLLPSFFVLVACCFSPVNGYYRYAFPMILTVPVACTGVFLLSKKQAKQNIRMNETRLTYKIVSE